jgi:tripartite-type tricarboxylate transporter receptor subunit TctC
MVVPFGAGGGTDAVARVLSKAAEEYLGQPIIVTNKPGAAGAPALIEVSRAKPDGYTLIFTGATIATLRHVGAADISYEDFDSVFGANNDPFAVSVREDAPWQTIEEFIDYAKQNPGKLLVGTTAPGGAWHNAAQALKSATGIDFKIVPFAEGAVPAINALLGGHVDAVTVSGVEIGPNVEAGKVRMLAVAGNERQEKFSEVPTFKERGIDVFPVSAFRGVLAPKGLPQEVLDKLGDAFMKASKKQEFIDFMNKNGYGIMRLGPKDWEEFLIEQDTGYGKLLKEISK